MTMITKIFTFDAAHSLPHHEGKCSQLHGHTYKLEVTVGGVAQSVDPKNSESGMIIDFTVLKAAVERVIDPLDHYLLNNIIPYPTAERLAEWIFNHIRAELRQLPRRELFPISLERVRLWETPTSYAEVSLGRR